MLRVAAIALLAGVLIIGCAPSETVQLELDTTAIHVPVVYVNDFGPTTWALIDSAVIKFDTCHQCRFERFSTHYRLRCLKAIARCR